MQRFIAFIALICILLASCTQKRSDKQKDVNDAFTPSHPSSLYAANSLIIALNNDKPLQDQHIGYSGGESDSYKYFQQLKKYAPDSTLLRLTYHNNPKMRVYGMWALTERNIKLARQQLHRFKNDQVEIVYQSGCVGMYYSVSSLVLSQFESSDLGINHSTGQFIKEPYRPHICFSNGF